MVFDPKVDLTAGYGDGLINRGVATWLDPAAPAGKLCRRRIYEATLDARLLALDAATGTPCPDFGQDGEIAAFMGDLEVSQSRLVSRMTSPPAVVDDLVIVGLEHQ